MSLVICPPTLVDHWVHEIVKYLGSGILFPRAIQGPLQHRAALLQQPASGADVLIMSYESLRADVDILKQRQWNYLILDEGHAIRNPKSKISQVCSCSLQSLKSLDSSRPAQQSPCCVI